MNNKINALRAIRIELELHRPSTGLAKWENKINSLRVAGKPRSVSMAVQVALLIDIIADDEVEEQFKPRLRETLEHQMQCRAYRETIWLNPKLLKKYLAEFRAKDYREPEGYTWT